MSSLRVDHGEEFVPYFFIAEIAAGPARVLNAHEFGSLNPE